MVVNFEFAVLEGGGEEGGIGGDGFLGCIRKGQGDSC